MQKQEPPLAWHVLPSSTQGKAHPAGRLDMVAQRRCGLCHGPGAIVEDHEGRHHGQDEGERPQGGGCQEQERSRHGWVLRGIPLRTPRRKGSAGNNPVGPGDRRLDDMAFIPHRDHRYIAGRPCIRRWSRRTGRRLWERSLSIRWPGMPRARSRRAGRPRPRNSETLHPWIVIRSDDSLRMLRSAVMVEPGTTSPNDLNGGSTKIRRPPARDKAAEIEP